MIVTVDSLDDALASIAEETAVALLLGHEGDGLTAAARDAADKRVRIAMRAGAAWVGPAARQPRPGARFRW